MMTLAVDAFQQNPHSNPKPVFSKKLAAKIAKRAEQKVDKITKSSLLNSSRDNTKDSLQQDEAQGEVQPACARFFKEEINLNFRLARGGFCEIWAVESFIPQDIACNSSEEEKQFAMTEKDFEAREKLFETQACNKALSSRRNAGKTAEREYVVKHLRRELSNNPMQFLTAAIDLGREAHILSSIQHRNIVKLRGKSVEGVSSYASGFHDGCFLIFDRLTDTLESRIETWSSKSKSLGRLLPERRRQLLAERLKICSDIAGALDYLHGRNIMHRDLKPSNLGFDIQGNIQLFDFGLAEELPHGQDNYKVTHKLEGCIGPPRYMAPEIARAEPYNLTADTYSFSLLCYSVLALIKPFKKLDASKLMETVFCRNGKRPCVQRSSWSDATCKLLEDGWACDASSRPTMKKAYRILKNEYASISANRRPSILRRSSIDSVCDVDNQMKGSKRCQRNQIGVIGPSMGRNIHK
jgi:serine/threonine protein kinase